MFVTVYMQTYLRIFLLTGIKVKKEIIQNQIKILYLNYIWTIQNNKIINLALAEYRNLFFVSIFQNPSEQVKYPFTSSYSILYIVL